MISSEAFEDVILLYTTTLSVANLPEKSVPGSRFQWIIATSPNSGRLGSPDAVGRVLENDRFVLLDVELLERQKKQVRVRLGTLYPNLIRGDDLVKIIEDPQSFGMRIHPRMRRAGGDRQPEPELLRFAQIIQHTRHDSLPKRHFVALVA